MIGFIGSTWAWKWLETTTTINIDFIAAVIIKKYAFPKEILGLANKATDKIQAQ